MTCVKTYWPAYIGAPAIKTSRRGRKTSEKIQVDNARKRHFTEKYQIVILSPPNNAGTPVSQTLNLTDQLRVRGNCKGASDIPVRGSASTAVLVRHLTSL